MQQKEDKQPKLNQEPMNQESRETKQVYICSCGKSYKSFAAIYLHFRNKHEIKLSTKPTETRKCIQEQKEFTKIFYTVDDLKNQTKTIEKEGLRRTSRKIHGQGPTKSQKISIGEEWLDEMQKCIEKYTQEFPQFSNEVFLKLKKFLEYELENNHKLIPIARIPHYLNKFMLNYLPSCGQPVKTSHQKWSQYCEQLLHFSHWLRKHNYTNLIVLFEHSELSQ